MVNRINLEVEYCHSGKLRSQGQVQAIWVSCPFLWVFAKNSIMTSLFLNVVVLLQVPEQTLLLA
jgi:hypothetical protein